MAGSSVHRHGRLLCRGAPLSFLDGEWVRQDSDVKSSPRYAHSDDPKLHLTSDGAAWRVTRGAGSGEVIAEAASTALHPGTVEVGSWKVFDRGKELPKSAELEMLCDGPNTEEQPFLMEELGRDFFLRVHLTRKVVWFVCPATGDIYHSAAKPGGEGGRSKPGKRYCHLCNKCFSANNFQSQHLVNLHPELVAKKPPKEKKEKKLAGLEKNMPSPADPERVKTLIHALLCPSDGPSDRPDYTAEVAALQGLIKRMEAHAAECQIGANVPGSKKKSCAQCTRWRQLQKLRDRFTRQLLQHGPGRPKQPEGEASSSSSPPKLLKRQVTMLLESAENAADLDLSRLPMLVDKELSAQSRRQQA
ncbi:hypothetical protein EMIHUDRAFT_459926, partial [Emiliania huxleyi CCMP1516]|uniref:C2H2-type domain-containing protein n=2 Tax=Emiliania huxleyi TaxID=2903 RepID=A0A0D3ICY9_EMIH1